ncbi:hypothetical protein WJX74_007297 [Apatococcus lobatus]|uniref:BRCT domain-containing protein n=1 Tax=Apatococcus lobatus TaxID=904363 RepID=A0AAW1S554_9CHLO
MSLFQGMCFWIEVAEPNLHCRPRMLKDIEAHGGTICTDLAVATVAVLQHQQQAAHSLSRSLSVRTVSWCWVVRSAYAQTLLPYEDQINQPWPSVSIPGSAGCKVTVTGFLGSFRHIVLDLLQCMGVEVQKNMHLPVITHIVAVDVHDQKSAKLCAARLPEHQHKISIININWLYDSIRAWSVQPAGPYTGNPPEDTVPATPVDASDDPPGLAPALPAVPAQPNFQAALPSAADAVALLPNGHHLPASNGSLPPSGLQVVDAMASTGKLVQELNVHSEQQHRITTAEEVPIGEAMQPQWSGATLPAAARTLPSRVLSDTNDSKPHLPSRTRKSTQSMNTAKTSRPGFTGEALEGGHIPHASSTPGQGMPLNAIGPASVPPGTGAIARTALAELDTAAAQLSAYRATETAKLGRAGSGLPNAVTPEPQMVLPDAAETVETWHERAAPKVPGATHANAASMPKPARRRLAAAPAAAAASVPQPARRRPVADHAKAAAIAASRKADAEAASENEAGDGAQGDVAVPAKAVVRRAAAASAGPGAQCDSGKESNGSGSHLQRRALAKPGSAAVEAGQTAKQRRPAEEPVSRKRTASSNKQRPQNASKNVIVPARWQDVIGRSVQVPFDDQLFEGKVVSYDRRAKFFKIKFADGDSEERAHHELEAVLLPESDAQLPAAREAEDPGLAGPSGKARPLIVEPFHRGPEGQSAMARHSAASMKRSSKANKPGNRGSSGAPGTARAALKEGRENEQRPAKRAKTVQPKPTSPLIPGQYKDLGICIALSGLHTEEQDSAAAMLRGMKVHCLTGLQSHSWCAGVTHVVAPALVRNRKIVAAMAAGNWLLHTSFLDACRTSKSLVQEADHELHACHSGIIQPGAPSHWRRRQKELEHGAFHELQVLIAPGADEEANLRAGDLAMLVLAGGGTVLAQRGASFSSLVASQCNAGAAGQAGVAIFQPSGKHAQDKARLRRAGIPCMQPLFLIEWVTHPWSDLKSHFAAQDKIPARLLSLMEQRSIAQAAMSPSI